MPKVERVVYRNRTLSHMDRAQIRAIERTGAFTRQDLVAIYRNNPRAIARAVENNLKGPNKGDPANDHKLLDEEFLKVLATHDLSALKKYVDQSIERQILEETQGKATSPRPRTGKKSPPAAAGVDETSDSEIPPTGLSSRARPTVFLGVAPAYHDGKSAPSSSLRTSVGPPVPEATLQEKDEADLRVLAGVPCPDVTSQAPSPKTEMPTQAPHQPSTVVPANSAHLERESRSTSTASVVKTEDDDDDIRDIAPKAEVSDAQPLSEDVVLDFFVNLGFERRLSAECARVVEGLGIHTREDLSDLKDLPAQEQEMFRKEFQKEAGMSYFKSLKVMAGWKAYQP